MMNVLSLILLLMIKDLMIIIILNLVKPLVCLHGLLRFFGYEQQRNVFFQETGQINYGS